MEETKNMPCLLSYSQHALLVPLCTATVTATTTTTTSSLTHTLHLSALSLSLKTDPNPLYAFLSLKLSNIYSIILIVLIRQKSCNLIKILWILTHTKPALLVLYIRVATFNKNFILISVHVRLTFFVIYRCNDSDVAHLYL